MNTDDIVYISLLVSCILFGHLYRRVLDADRAKLMGTGFGLLIVFVVSGWHALHPLLSTGACAAIILGVDRRKSHLVAFAFMFAYLFFFRTTDYFGIPLPSGHTNMIQMILTLKLVGLAFEANTAHTNAKAAHADNDGNDSPMSAELASEQQMFAQLSVADIFHYAFNYIGVLTGPYYRYRTFHDYFTLPFREQANCAQATLRKFAWVPVFAGAYLLVSHQWPLSYATSDEFHEQRSVLYRLWYVWPTFFIFRMRIYIGITLSECVCTMAGFGAYPAAAQSTPGGGPRIDYRQPTATGHTTAPIDGAFDFETIHNVDAYTTDTCWTFREAMKSWNMCVQYWLAVNVYKRFPSKAYRTLVTLLVSAVWHGVYSGYYFCILGAPFYLPIEDIWHKLLRKDAAEPAGWRRRAIDVLFWTSKFFAFSYMGIAFQLMTLDKIWFYYSSVHHLGYLYFAVMYVVGRVLLAQRKSAARSSETPRAAGEKKIN